MFFLARRMPNKRAAKAQEKMGDGRLVKWSGDKSGRTLLDAGELYLRGEIKAVVKGCNNADRRCGITPSFFAVCVTR